MLIAVISSIITILAIIILIIKLKKEKLCFYNNKILESENELQRSFENKFSILSELQTKLSSQSNEVEFNLLCNFEEFENDDFMLNAILNKAHKEVNTFLEERRAFIPDNETKKLINDLHQIDIECTALKNYYNENSKILNNLIKKFPNKSIAKFLKISKKELYNDPIEEEFEILKKK